MLPATASVQRVELPGAVVAETERGALELADPYWAEIRRLTGGLVRVRRPARGPELRLGRALVLFRFGPPRTRTDGGLVECRFAIVGGLLAKREGGWLTFTQRVAPTPSLEVRVEDYVPRLGSERRPRSVRGFIYRQAQERVHSAVGRRYLERMARSVR